jgi:hypothetical protein
MELNIKNGGGKGDFHLSEVKKERLDKVIKKHDEIKEEKKKKKGVFLAKPQKVFAFMGIAMFSVCFIISILYIVKTVELGKSIEAVYGKKYLSVFERVIKENGLWSKQGEISKVFSFVQEYSLKYKIDKYLVLALISEKSKYQNSKGGDAVGYMRIVPWKHGIPEETLFIVETNINIGVKYLSQLIKKYNGNIYSALVEYNGEKTKDTFQFSTNVMRLYSSFTN